MENEQEVDIWSERAEGNLDVTTAGGKICVTAPGDSLEALSVLANIVPGAREAAQTPNREHPNMTLERWI